jgi:8-oxo-dGTP pyrophosphatase MutT (NUDIX family)
MSNGKEFREQSAVIPYRKKNDGVEVLLITSLDTGRWVLPKGHIEKGLSARESAEKEAFEEAGIKGDVAKQSVGAYRYAKTDKKGGGMRRVSVFPMEVQSELDEWPEKGKRTRRWMDVEAAAQAVDEKKLGKILLSFLQTQPKKKAAS